jgi:hypothetical protein
LATALDASTSDSSSAPENAMTVARVTALPKFRVRSRNCGPLSRSRQHRRRGMQAGLIPRHDGISRVRSGTRTPTPDRGPSDVGTRYARNETLTDVSRIAEL